MNHLARGENERIDRRLATDRKLSKMLGTKAFPAMVARAIRSGAKRDMRHTIITGGAGFIGSHTVDHLLRSGHAVTVVDDFSTGSRQNLSHVSADGDLMIVEADVAEALAPALQRSLPADRLASTTGIVHLAAQVSVARSVERPLADTRTNIRGVAQVLELARGLGEESSRPKVVFASSAAVYGDVEEVPTPEDAPLRPLSPYGVNKLSSEHWLAMYSDTLGVPTSALRFFNVYGPRQDPTSGYSGVISIFLDRGSDGVTLRIFGDGEQTRDFVYVGDVARAIGAALETPGHTPPTNVGTGIRTSVKELAQVILKVLGSHSDIRFEEARKGDILHSCARVEKLEKRFGVQAKIGLEEGLKETAAWHQSLRTGNAS